MSDNGSARLLRWTDLETDHPLEEVNRRRIFGEQAMLSEVRFRKGCHVPTHHHENEQFVCVISGCLRFGLGADDDPGRRDVVVRAGEVLVLPSNVPHSADALEKTLVLDIFSPPSATTGLDDAGRDD